MREVEKYERIYASQDRVRQYRGYGHTNHGRALLPHFLSLSPESVLDVGCGHNAWIHLLAEHGVRGTGVDFACPGADLIAEADNLPFDDKEWDFVTAFDVLEHLLPNQVDAVLLEMARVSSRFAFSICYRDSVLKVEDHTLHPCVRPEGWWMEMISKLGTPEKHGIYVLGSWLR